MGRIADQKEKSIMSYDMINISNGEYMKFVSKLPYTPKPLLKPITTVEIGNNIDVVDKSTL